MILLRVFASAVAFLALTSMPAHAQQVAVYGAADITVFSFTNNGIGPDYKPGVGGFTVGGFYNFPIQSRLTAGIDVRDTYSPGVKGGNALGIAFRVAFVPEQVRLRPFFQIGGGVVSSTASIEIQNDNRLNANQRYTNGAFLLDFGLDIRLTKSIDLRALDYGAEAGGTTGITFANIGVIFHFPLASNAARAYPGKSRPLVSFDSFPLAAVDTLRCKV